MGNNFTPLFYALAVIFVLSIVFTLVATSFDLVPQSDSTVLTFLASGVQSGFNITVPDIDPFNILPDLTLNFNPFGLLPDSIVNFIYSDIITLSYIPSIILIPLSILLFIALVYGIVKVVLP
jgi:hypothetical protein